MSHNHFQVMTLGIPAAVDGVPYRINNRYEC